jgi:hypothetical protein
MAEFEQLAWSPRARQPRVPTSGTLQAVHVEAVARDPTDPRMHVRKGATRVLRPAACRSRRAGGDSTLPSCSAGRF